MGNVRCTVSTRCLIIGGQQRIDFQGRSFTFKQFSEEKKVDQYRACAYRFLCTSRVTLALIGLQHFVQVHWTLFYTYSYRKRNVNRRSTIAEYFNVHLMMLYICTCKEAFCNGKGKRVTTK